jgi:cytochrome c biogenesis protein CcdA
MLRLIGLIASIGIADSVNPTTIGPALYLAPGERGRGRLAAFTLAVFVVNLLGGVAIALGPGQLVRSAFPANHLATHILEVVVGAGMIGFSGFLWGRRRRLAEQDPPLSDPNRRSSAILGATITALELPTAFPYFAAIAAIVGSGVDATRQVVVLVLFNVCFVFPLVAIFVLLVATGDAGANRLARARARFQVHWPIALSGLALLAGVIAVLIGVSGLTAHSAFSRFVGTRLSLRHLGG